MNQPEACVYEFEQGMNWQSDLRSQISRQNDELCRLTAILDRMRFGTDGEAAELLARLRLGDSIEELFDSLNVLLSNPWQ